MSQDIQQDIHQYYDFWFCVNELYEQWAKQRRVTSNELFVLHTIYENAAGCTQQQICAKLLLPKQTVNSILTGLEQDGYVRKETDPQDKRNKLLFFTAAGQQYATSILTALEQFESRALSAMTAEQRTIMLDHFELFLQQLLRSFEEDTPTETSDEL